MTDLPIPDRFDGSARPIIFSAEMVMAILTGKKTMTRRVLKLPKSFKPTIDIAAWYGDGEGDWIGWANAQPEFSADTILFYPITGRGIKCPYGKPGDRLWVRETLKMDSIFWWYYAADDTPIMLPPQDPRIEQMLSWAHHKEQDYCPSIHMPRWASRITLEVVFVYLERLQDIADADILSEGITDPALAVNAAVALPSVPTLQERWRFIWDHINAKRDDGLYAWEQNPWVWVITFRRLT